MARKNERSEEFSIGGHEEGEFGVIPQVEDLRPNVSPAIAVPDVPVPADANGMIPLSSLKDVIAIAVREAMSGQSAMFGETMKGLLPRRIVDFGEFSEKGLAKSPFNWSKTEKRFLTDGEKPTLTRQCYQNGYRLQEEKLHPEEIEMINLVTRPGFYIERMVEVIIREDGSSETLELRYKNKTPDQRSELKGEAKNFGIILKRILEEQAEADEEETLSSLRRASGRRNRE